MGRPTLVPDDWRLVGQERSLGGLTLHRARWVQTRPHWDYDHCAFCWRKIWDRGGDYSATHGYTDADQYHWVCDGCFGDFRWRMGWRCRS